MHYLLHNSIRKLLYNVQKTFGRVRKRHLYFFFFSCSRYCSTHNRLTLKPILGHRHHPVLTRKRQSLPILSLRCDSTRRLSRSESFLARTQISLRQEFRTKRVWGRKKNLLKNQSIFPKSLSLSQCFDFQKCLLFFIYKNRKIVA